MVDDETNAVQTRLGTRIGLEIHAQLAVPEKLFCTCSPEYSKNPPNTNICPVCTGQPGSKPALPNRAAIESVLAIVLMLDCTPTKHAVFQRKHYFYPDLPNNYQRTSTPMGVSGMLGGVRIREVHLEEDPGRYDLRRGTVDYNRSGVSLVEIVTEPDMKSVEDASRFLKELTHTLEYLNVVRLGEGSVRIDVNISLKGGDRVEVKNVNSFHGVRSALRYEMVRQHNRLRSGLGIIRETRHFNEEQGITTSLREKETAADYRHIPDPDLPRIMIDPETVNVIRSRIPESPKRRAGRMGSEYGLSLRTASIITKERDFADFFEEAAGLIGQKHKEKVRELAAFLSHELRRVLNWNKMMVSDSGIRPVQVCTLVGLVRSRSITRSTAHKMIEELIVSPQDPESMVCDKNLYRMSEEEKILLAIEQVIESEENAVADWTAGKTESLEFLMGRVMSQTNFRADHKMARELLTRTLHRSFSADKK